MDYVRLGRTGLKVSRLCLGTMNFGPQTSEPDSHRIIYQGFSLLTANREVFIDSNVRAMAERYKTGVAQIIFRFAMQIGMLPLTGTTNVQHMTEDLRCDQFTLTADELHHIETIGL